MKSPPATLPICAATVEILGAVWPAKSTIWAGLLLHKAIDAGPDRLRVPWAHVDDPPWKDDAIYSLYPRDDRYRFARARNRVWVLVLRGAV